PRPLPLAAHEDPPPFPTRRSSDLNEIRRIAADLAQPSGTGGDQCRAASMRLQCRAPVRLRPDRGHQRDRGRLAGVLYLREGALRSEEHTSELQSRENLVCRLLLEK